MEENVQKELEVLRDMVLRWKESHLRWVTPEGGDDYLVKDFSEEIERHVVPYVGRLFKCNYLTNVEAKEFLDFCYAQVEELKIALAGPDEEPIKGFWHMLAGE